MGVLLELAINAVVSAAVGGVVAVLIDHIYWERHKCK